MSNALSEIANLLDQVAERDRTIRRLKNELCGAFVPPEEWALTRAEIIVAQLLFHRPLVTMEAIRVMLGPKIRKDDGEHLDCSIYGYVSTTRRKLKPYGYQVLGSRYVGWRLVRPGEAAR